MDARKDQHRQKALTQQELAVSNEGGSLLGKINVEVVGSVGDGDVKKEAEDAELDPALKRYYNSLENDREEEVKMVIEEGSSGEESEDDFTTVKQ
jgi:hypothetical protein